jgi:biopolymer transport protein ExbD
MHKAMRRTGLRIDMTAMVDVAFLLLTFFMLTTQFKPPEVIPIELPSSHAEFKLPASDILMITVGRGGEIFVGTEIPGSDVAVDTTDLTDVLVQIRSQNPSVRTAIKADYGVSYGPIQDVMEKLKEARITRFSLITNLEGDDEGEEASS